MTDSNGLNLKSFWLEFKKYSIFVFYFLYILSILHILRLTARGFAREFGSPNISGLDFVMDFVRTYTFIIIFNAILIYNLLLRKQLAYFFTLLLIIGGLFLGLTKHYQVIWSISALIQILLLVIHFNDFKVKDISHNFKRKLSVGVSLFIGMLLYYFLGFKILANSFRGSVSTLNIVGNYLSNFIDPSSLDFYINDITPLNILAKLYLNSLEYVGWVISILIAITMFSGVKVKLPHLNNSIQLKNNIESDEDSLAVFKNLPNLQRFESQGDILYYQQKESLKIVLGDPILKNEQNIQSLKEFIDTSHKEGQIVALFQTTHITASKLKEIGLINFLLGYEAIVDLKTFEIIGPNQSDLRYARNKLYRENVKIEYIKFADIDSSQLKIFEVLKKVWARDKGNGELGFSSNLWPLNPEIDGWLVLAKDENFGYVGACTFLPFGKKSLVLDFMIQSPFARPQFMDGLLTASILQFKEMEYEKISLGLAPVDLLTKNKLINTVTKSIQHLQKNTYKYEGLRKFKQKFNPKWEERYLIVEGLETLPLVLQFLANIFYKKK